MRLAFAPRLLKQYRMYDDGLRFKAVCVQALDFEGNTKEPSTEKMRIETWPGDGPCVEDAPCPRLHTACV